VEAVEAAEMFHFRHRHRLLQARNTAAQAGSEVGE